METNTTSQVTPHQKKKISIPWILYLLFALFINVSSVFDSTNTRWDYLDYAVFAPAFIVGVLYALRKPVGKAIVWKCIAAAYVAFDLTYNVWLDSAQNRPHGWEWLALVVFAGPFYYLLIRVALKGLPQPTLVAANAPLQDAHHVVLGRWRKILFVTSVVMAWFYAVMLVIGQIGAFVTTPTSRTVSAYIFAGLDVVLAVVTVWAVSKRKLWARWLLISIFALSFIGHEFDQGTWFWVYYFLAFFAVYFTIPALPSAKDFETGKPLPKHTTARWLWIWLGVTLCTGLFSIAHGGDPYEQLGSFALVLIAAVILSIRDWRARRADMKKAKS